MPDKLNIAIVGLGIVGASAGLALRRFQDKVTVIGHDREPSNASTAKKLGAVDRTEWNLINTVSGADRILLALPLSELRATLQAIAVDLKPGCVLIDTAEVKSAVMQWARELLPSGVHFVGGHPIIIPETSSTEGAKADLFERKLFCLTPDATTDQTAVRLAADVVEALGAQPFFLDPTEHDGLVAAVEHLPALMAAALMAITGGSTGWQDMRKLAAGQYRVSTLIEAESGKSVVAGPAANRQHVLHWMDALIAELSAWRDRLAQGDDDGLASEVERGLVTNRKWLSAYTRGSWDEETSQPDVPTAGSALREMFIGRMRLPTDRTKRK